MKVISRNTVFATIIALTLVSISVTSVFAAGPLYQSNSGNSNQGLESKWKAELASLQSYKSLENQIATWMSVWLKTNQLSHSRRAKENGYANEVHLTLQQAEIVAAKHAGFDAQGRVTDKTQATQSIKNLSGYLHQLRVVFIQKLHHHLQKQ